MASCMSDDYVVYDFSDEEPINSSDEETALPLEKWLKSKLTHNTPPSKHTPSIPGGGGGARSVDDILEEDPQQILTPKEMKKLNEKAFEQSMEDAMAELDSLDDINMTSSSCEQNSNSPKTPNSRKVHFAKNVQTSQLSEAAKKSTEEKLKSNVNNDSLHDKNATTTAEAENESEENQSDDVSDPFYDPEADEEDERWVQNERLKHLKNSSQSSSSNNNKQTGNQQKRSAKSTFSDAILSCPACMTIVCIDCQRHQIYPNQYRAMFTMNCSVSYGELLHLTEKSKKRSKRRGAKQSKGEEDSGNNSNILAEGMQCVKKELDCSNGVKLKDDQFHPVKCDVCTTEVAVYDKDEIYHFFNTIASLS